MRYTPWVNVDSADGLWLDITGCAHLFGDEAALIADLEQRLKRLSVTAWAGIADTPGAAWALARFAPEEAPLGRIAPSGETDRRLADLPVRGLRLRDDADLLLRRLGLTRIGQLYDLPRASLARRFGADARPGLSDAVLDRLDQALGKKTEPISPLHSVPVYRTHLRFAEPLVSHDGVDAALRHLLDVLCGMLGEDYRGVRSLRLGVFRVDGTATRLDIATGRGVRDSGRLMRLFAERLDKIDPGFGIDMMMLSAHRTDSMLPEQVALEAHAASADRDAVGHLVDRLSNRFGSARVYRLAARQRHVPERAERCIPAQKGEVSSEPWGEPWNSQAVQRPARLLLRPEAIEVIAEVPEGPPARFVWRHMAHRIIRSAGPERVAPEWWLEAGADFARVRDYYRVESETGQRFWLYREGLYHALKPGSTPRWFMHGLFG